MPKIDQAAVASVQMPVLSLTEQHRIGEELDEIQQSRALVATTAERQKRRSQALRRALLAVAFSGGLTARHADVEVIEELANDNP
jgi:hypothetical protein